MKLNVGKMSTKDLAEFFEVSYSYFRTKKVKERYMTLLEQYADYENVYGGVNILKVKKSEYIPEKLPLRELFERELKKLPTSQYYEDQVYGSLIQIAEATLEEVNRIQQERGLRIWTSPKTLANKYSEISKELYGEKKFNQRLYERGGFYTIPQIEEGRGPLGIRLSCMLIKTETGYRELSKQERELFSKISEEYDKEHELDIKEELLAYREVAYNKKYESDSEAQCTLSAIEDKWAKDFGIIRNKFVAETHLTLVPRGTAWKDVEETKWAF